MKAEALPVHVHEVGYVLQSEALYEKNIYHWKRKRFIPKPNSWTKSRKKSWEYSSLLFTVTSTHMINMNIDLQSLLGLLTAVYSCNHWLRPRNSPPPPRPHLGSYTRALLVRQERRHLFVTFQVLRLNFWTKSREKSWEFSSLLFIVTSTLYSYSFALRFLFLQTQATSHYFYRKFTIQCKREKKGGKPVRKP